MEDKKEIREKLAFTQYIFFFVALATAFLFLQHVYAETTTHHVCAAVGPNCEFTSIGAALADVSVLAGDTIEIESDYVTEAETFPLTIAKENITIDCMDPSSGALIGTVGGGDNVTLQLSASGGVIENCRFSKTIINSDTSSNININNNIFVEDTGSAIDVRGVVGVIVRNNSGLNAIYFDSVESGEVFNNVVEVRQISPEWYRAGVMIDGNSLEITGNTVNFRVAINEGLYSAIRVNSPGIGLENSDITINDNHIQYFESITGGYGAALDIGGSEIILSNNYIILPDNSSTNLGGINGIQLYAYQGDVTATIRHNTIYIPDTCLDVTGIKIQSEMNADNNLTADINYNLIYTGVENDDRNGMSISNWDESLGVFVINDDYNGYSGTDTEGDTVGYDDEAINIVRTNGGHDVIGNPFLMTGDADLTNDLHPAPFSHYLDVNGDEDIGAYSGERRNIINVDENGVIDYSTVDLTSLVDINDVLRTGDTIDIAPGIYGSLTLEDKSGVTVSGAGENTVLDATIFADGIYFRGVDSSTIQNLKVQNANSIAKDFNLVFQPYSYGGHDYVDDYDDGEVSSPYIQVVRGFDSDCSGPGDGNPTGIDIRDYVLATEDFDLDNPVPSDLHLALVHSVRGGYDIYTTYLFNATDFADEEAALAWLEDEWDIDEGNEVTIDYWAAGTFEYNSDSGLFEYNAPSAGDLGTPETITTYQGGEPGINITAPAELYNLVYQPYSFNGHDYDSEWSIDDGEVNTPTMRIIGFGYNSDDNQWEDGGDDDPLDIEDDPVTDGVEIQGYINSSAPQDWNIALVHYLIGGSTDVYETLIFSNVVASSQEEAQAWISDNIEEGNTGTIDYWMPLTFIYNAETEQYSYNAPIEDPVTHSTPTPITTWQDGMPGIIHTIGRFAGISLDNSSGNTLSNVILDNNAYGVQFLGDAADNVISESMISDSELFDIHDLASGDNDLKNVSFDRIFSAIYRPGVVNVYFKAQAFVTNEADEPLDDAVINFEDSAATPASVLSSDGTGYTDFTDYLLAYVMDESSVEVINGGYNPFTVSMANPPENFSATTTENLINPNQIFSLVLTEAHPPLAPSSCAVSAVTGSSVAVEWADNSDNEDGFTLEVSSDGIDYVVVSDEIPANIIAKGAGELDFDTQYWFRVKAVNPDGSSDYAVCAPTTTLDTETIEPFRFDAKWGSAGSGNSQFDYPVGVTLQQPDSHDFVYIADVDNCRVQVFNADGSYVTEWGENGTGDGQFNAPYEIGVDLDDNVYVVDQGNNRIQKFDSSGTYLDQFGGLGSGEGELDDPSDVATDSDNNVYVVDQRNNRIQKFDYDGNYLTEWGGEGSNDGQFNGPISIAIDQTDNVYITDAGNHRIQKFDSSGAYLDAWGSEGTGDGQFTIALSIAFDSVGRIYVADATMGGGTQRIQIFDSSGNYLGQFGSEGSGNGQFIYPHSVAVDSENNVYAVDSENARIEKFVPNIEAPTLVELVPITTPTSDTTPNYAFTSNEVGIISYGGDCESSTIVAEAGENTVTFNALSAGNYDNCTITLTNLSGVVSNTLLLEAFIIENNTPGHVSSPPTGPTIETPNVISPTEIQWNFQDNADNEIGFRLLDMFGLEITTEAVPNLTFINEIGLTPNTAYQRQIIAYNGDGNSNQASTISVYTFAEVPAISKVEVQSDTAVLLTLDAKSNPLGTRYAIYESSTNKWLQTDHTLGEIKTYQTAGFWSSDDKIVVNNLQSGNVYTFRVMAKNEADIETDLSPSVSGIPQIVSGPNLVLSKISGINVVPQVATAALFGTPVFASGIKGEIIKVLPFYSVLASGYLIVVLILLLLSILLLIINTTEKRILDKIKKLRHIPKIIFTDWKAQKGDELYLLLHGKNEPKQGVKYLQHHVYYRYTALAVLAVGIGTLAKLALVASMYAIIFGGIGIYAFENQSGEPVQFGDEITYHVNYVSNGTMDVTGIELKDSIPNQASYIAGSLVLNGVAQTDADDRDDCYKEGALIACRIERAKQGESGYLEFRTIVAGVVGNTLTNTASAKHDYVSASLYSNSVTNTIIQASTLECSDSLDNDGDGLIDYPGDIGCSSATDDTENSEMTIGPGETRDVVLSSGWNFYRMAVTSKARFTHNGATHAVELTSSNVLSTRAGLRITSDPVNVSLDEAQVVGVDSDGNGLEDLDVMIQTVESDTVSVVGINQKEENILPACGDLVCNGTETCSTCVGDCGVCPKAQCGDGLDNDGDSKVDFPADLGCTSLLDNNETNVIPPVCGDAQCNGTETCDSCSQDCGICPPLAFCGDAICNAGETCNTCSEDCGVCPPPAFCGDDSCNAGETCNSCSEDCGTCVIVEPPTTGGTANACSDNLDNDQDGKIDMADQGCINLNDTDETDEVLTEEETEEQETAIAEQKIGNELETSKVVNAISTIVSGLTGQDFADVKTEVKKVITTTLINSIDNPTVEKINDFVQEPAAIAATSASVASIATVGATGAAGVGILTYLQFLFTQPIMLCTRKKRSAWGVVYDSITKQPVDLATVRLFRVKRVGQYQNVKLISTRVTDTKGRYQFAVEPGEYFIDIKRVGYVFPSVLLGNSMTDSTFERKYYGGPVIVGEDMVINNAIALDPNKREYNNHTVLRLFKLRKIQKIIVLFGPAVAIFSFLINPEVWAGGVVLLQVGAYFIFKRLGRGKKSKNFGQVIDKETGGKLAHAIVRVFDSRFNKLLDTQVTGRDGQYSLLVGCGRYYLTSEKKGYLLTKLEKEIDNEQQACIVDEIKMDKV